MRSRMRFGSRETMKNLMICGLAALAAGCSAPGKPVAGAMEPDAPTPVAGYRSAFENYAGFRDEEPGDWRRLNEEVGRVGGHRGALRP
jgi:hypothetical protein